MRRSQTDAPALHLSYVRATDGGFFEGLHAGAMRLGFDSCGYTIGIPGANGDIRFVMINSFPKSWQERYRRGGLHVADPTLLHGMRDSRPLIWSSASLDAPAEWREAANAAGFNHGWTKATHDASGRFGVLTLARNRGPIAAQELQDNLPTMLWLAQLSHSVLFRVLYSRHRHRARASLTARELLILRLVADGRSSLEIANAVGITERTVGFHLGNAVNKLDATNKTHAVVTAIRMGLLD